MKTTPVGVPTNPVDRVNEIAGRYGPDSLIGTLIRRAEQEICASTARVLERVAVLQRGGPQAFQVRASAEAELVICRLTRSVHPFQSCLGGLKQPL